MRKCSRHDVALVIKRLNYTDHRGTGRVLEYLGCPVRGCSYARPYKYQMKPYKPRGEKQ